MRLYFGARRRFDATVTPLNQHILSHSVYCNCFLGLLSVVSVFFNRIVNESHMSFSNYTHTDRTMKTSWRNMKNNREILHMARLKQNIMIGMVIERKAKYFGHIKKTPESLEIYI